MGESLTRPVASLLLLCPSICRRGANLVQIAGGLVGFWLSGTFGGLRSKVKKMKAKFDKDIQVGEALPIGGVHHEAGGGGSLLLFFLGGERGEFLAHQSEFACCWMERVSRMLF